MTNESFQKKVISMKSNLFICRVNKFKNFYLIKSYNLRENLGLNEIVVKYLKSYLFKE